LEGEVLYALRLRNIKTIAFVYGDDAARTACADIEAYLTRTLDEAEPAARIARRGLGAYDVQLSSYQSLIRN
jgi:hypothetical protein